MPRRAYKRRNPGADPVFDSIEVAKLINYIMIDGKKTVAEGIVYDVMEKLKEIEKDPVKALTKPKTQNLKPKIQNSKPKT